MLPGGIRTRNTIKRAAAEQRLRSLGQSDWRYLIRRNLLYITFKHIVIFARETDLNFAILYSLMLS